MTHPFEVMANAPQKKVYYTARWKAGIEGEVDRRFDDLLSNGFTPFRWDSKQHQARSAEDQVEAIGSFIERSNAYVFEIDDPDYPYGMSTYILGHVVFDTHLPVIFVDTTYTGSFGERHKVLRNLGGKCLDDQGRLHIVTTWEEAITTLKSL
jgi:hypothetical protein